MGGSNGHLLTVLYHGRMDFPDRPTIAGSRYPSMTGRVRTPRFAGDSDTCVNLVVMSKNTNRHHPCGGKTDVSTRVATSTVNPAAGKVACVIKRRIHVA
jgi:hypothetical protein